MTVLDIKLAISHVISTHKNIKWKEISWIWNQLRRSLWNKKCFFHLSWRHQCTGLELVYQTNEAAYAKCSKSIKCAGILGNKRVAQLVNKPTRGPHSLDLVVINYLQSFMKPNRTIRQRHHFRRSKCKLPEIYQKPSFIPLHRKANYENNRLYLNNFKRDHFDIWTELGSK